MCRYGLDENQIIVIIIVEREREKTIFLTVEEQTIVFPIHSD